MKKAILILLVGLLLSGNAFADSVEFKNCKFPHKAMDGVSNLDFKINMEDKSINWGPGFKYFNLRYMKDTNSEFYYEMKPFAGDDEYSYAIFKFDQKGKKIDVTVYGTTIWSKKPKYEEYPSQFMDLVCSETTPVSVGGSKVEIANMIDKAKSTCKELGFKEGSEKFADCSLKLYSQSVELAAKSNQTVVMQPQSSGSNTMTIYDPVRDSNALIKQGQRMLSGRCTLGIDC